MLKPERQEHENLALDDKAATVSVIIALAIMVLLAFQSFGSTFLLFGIGGGIAAVGATIVIWRATKRSHALVSREDDQSDIFKAVHQFQDAWYPCAITSGFFVFLCLITVSIGMNSTAGGLFALISVIAGIVNFYVTLAAFALNHRRIRAAMSVARSARPGAPSASTALPQPAQADNPIPPAPVAHTRISPSSPPQRPRGVRSIEEIAASHVRAATLTDYRDDVKLQTEILDAETAAVHSQVERERAFLRNDKRDFVLRADQARLEKEALSAEARLRELQADEREAGLARRTREQEVTKVEAKLEGRALDDPSDDDDVREFLATLRPERYGNKQEKFIAALCLERDKLVRELGDGGSLSEEQQRIVDDFWVRGMQKIKDSFPQEPPTRNQMRR